MSPETYRYSFKSGESAKRPLGGKICDQPFSRVLAELAIYRGYKSQRALAKALGKKHSTTVRAWYSGIHTPSAKEFGDLLILLDPPEAWRERLVSFYAEQMVQVKNKERLKRSIKHLRKSPEDEVGSWILAFCNERELTLGNFFRELNFSRHRVDRSFGLLMVSKILEEAPTVFKLNRKEALSLAEAVAAKIERETKQGRRYHKSLHGRALKRAQGELDCQTYNGSQAAEMLGTTREAVRQPRKKLGLPLLLLDKHMELLRKDTKTAKN